MKASDFFKSYSERSLLRFSVLGSVDDGKSTLIGRLLYDSQNLLDDHIASVKKAGTGKIDFSLFTDGLKAEREQNITIDVAYRYFSTEKRNFIVSDTPGHEQYTRNMVTGASNAQVAVVLIDAKNGILTQTKRHSFVASLLGIKKVVMVVNKMDLVSYSESVFNRICDDYKNFVLKLGFADVQIIPISALNGENLTSKSSNMPWYKGESLLHYLENVYVGAERNLRDFRFPVQSIIKDKQLNRFFAGQIQSGVVRVGDEIIVLPSRKKTKIKSIVTFDGELEVAFAPQSVSLVLEDEIDISRGDMIVRIGNQPQLVQSFEAMLIWLSESDMKNHVTYAIQIGPRSGKVDIGDIQYKINMNTLHREPVTSLKMNEVSRMVLHSRNQLIIDSYAKNRNTGGFILIDPETQVTVAAGFILDHTQNSTHVSKAKSIWLTGLSGAGKTTIADAVKKECEDYLRIAVLDGDVVRKGLSSDLGFTKEDRSENIRRTAEVAKILNASGINCIVSLISPYAEDRASAKKIIGDENFVEVYVSTPLEICEKRDTKGLYKKARTGEIQHFTGVSDPYEVPLNADLVIDANRSSVAECVAELMRLLKK